MKNFIKSDWNVNSTGVILYIKVRTIELETFPFYWCKPFAYIDRLRFFSLHFCQSMCKIWFFFLNLSIARRVCMVQQIVEQLQMWSVANAPFLNELFMFLCGFLLSSYFHLFNFLLPHDFWPFMQYKMQIFLSLIANYATVSHFGITSVLSIKVDSVRCICWSTVDSGFDYNVTRPRSRF